MITNVSDVLEQNVDDEREILAYEAELVRMDRTYEKTQSARDRLNEKLEKAINQIDFEALPTEKASSQLATVSLISTYMKSLEDTEKNTHQRVTAKFRRKENEDVQNVGAIVAEFLQKIDVRPPTALTNHDIHKTYDAMVTERSEEIGDIPDTVLRVDHEDIS